jgi:hypothetical protein
MSDTKVEKKALALRVLDAVMFGIFSSIVFYMTVQSSIPDTAMKELFAGSVIIGMIGLVCWIWPRYVATGFVLLVGATLAGSFLWPSEVNWPNAIALLVPCLVPFLLFAVPSLLRWLKSREGGMAG